MPLGDIINTLPGDDSNAQANAAEQIALLKSMDATLKQLVRNGQNISRDNASTRMNDYRHANTFRGMSSPRSSVGTFEEAFRKELMDAFIGSDFKKQVKGIFQALADDLGVSLSDLPQTLGKTLGKQAADLLKETSLGQALKQNVGGALQRGLDSVKARYEAGREQYYKDHPNAVRPTPVRNALTASRSSAESSNTGRNIVDSIFGGKKSPANMSVESLTVYAGSVVIQKGKNGSGITDAAQELLSKGMDAGDIGEAAGELGANADGASAMLAGLKSAAEPILEMAPEILAALVALKVAELAVKAAMWALTPAIDGAKEAFKEFARAAKRESESRKKAIEEGQKRLEADVHTMVEAPFKILEDAAQALYDTWDQNLRTIGQTQGYNKEQYLGLMGAFADRIRSEGLEREIAVSDVTNNLANVLKSGLTGAIAEEFAYQATKLNAAVPTQDFFGYASTYGELVANAIQRQGMTQEAAIEYATKELTSYASELLYASRDLSHGVTTGLQNASDIFAQSVHIAQAGRVSDVSSISGVMTAVSAITGAIAPDLASAMTDAIYKAATGGNSTEIVALRSLAGINASNTEFLKQLAQDPQSVFANLFDTLGARQKMSEDAYMEVAEGLSTVFGVSMDAFARVDFNQLAAAIRNMDTGNDAINENLSLLISGQTTTNKEQLKSQEINQYILENGLSYVIDSAEGRLIQQHMWDEQIALQIQEATYGVELQGKALSFLEGLTETADRILTIINPLRLANKAFNAIASVVETKALKTDVGKLLEATRVGSSNAQSYYNLTTRGKQLTVVEDLLTMLGSSSAYTGVSTARKAGSARANYMLGGNSASIWGWLSTSADINKYGKTFDAEASQFARPTSLYNWGNISKNAAQAAFSKDYGGVVATSLAQEAIQSASDQAAMEAAKSAERKINDAFKYMSDYISDKGADATYEGWAKKARSLYGISDLAKTLETVGMTEAQAMSQFDAAMTQVAAAKEADRKTQEENFWRDSLEKMDTRTDVLTTMKEMLESKLDKMINKLGSFYKDWTDYYIHHTYYDQAGMSYTKVAEIQAQEKESSDTAIYALADALTQNNVDLRDPAVQTNVLLAQVLKVLNVIAQQGTLGSDAGTALPDSIAGMALGITI